MSKYMNFNKYNKIKHKSALNIIKIKQLIELNIVSKYDIAIKYENNKYN